MSKKTLTDPTVLANGNAIYVLPNSVKYDDGLGQPNVRTASVGSGKVELIISENVEEKMSTISFDMPNTLEAIELEKAWKRNPGAIVFEVSAKIDGKAFNRAFTSAVITNKADKELSSDGKISVEASADPIA